MGNSDRLSFPGSSLGEIAGSGVKRRCAPPEMSRVCKTEAEGAARERCALVGNALSCGGLVNSFQANKGRG